jgi:PhzF family phenazine biosynthesis protein
VQERRAYVVDAFADAAFGGNPAGVVLLDDDAAVPDDDWLQAVAAEFRHAETAFVRPRADGAFDLRWFTPTTEVDLCGHATLAAAHIVANDGRTGRLTFHTRSGPLFAESVESEVRLDFPAQPPAPAAAPTGLQAALGTTPLGVTTNGTDVVVDLADADAVAAVRPDFAALALVECRGVIVTAPGAGVDGADFVSRFFGPRVGVDEDPVTGSAHCALGPLWADRLGRRDLVGVQLSARRGRVRVTVTGDRVHLTGRAVTVLAGRLLA